MSNPSHDNKGRFSSGHNAGGGNRSVADHIKNQHKETFGHKAVRYALTAAVAPAAAVVVGGVMAARGVHHLVKRMN